MSGKGPLGNAKAEKEAQRRAQLRERTFGNGVRHCMATPEGRAFLMHLVTVDGLAFAQSYDNSGSVTSYREGRRHVGLALMQHLKKHAKADWFRALAEAEADAEREANLQRLTPEDDDA